MMRSMFSGVSGLRTHQTKMDVIANNISNVNTVGFKSSRVTFNEVFSQSLSGASSASETSGRGGTNPMQIGLGVNISSIDKNMGTGAAQRTDRALDLMINGDGFFIVGDVTGTYFTRAGAFELDATGFLVMGNGLKVYGWDTKVSSDGVLSVQKERAQPIQIAGEKEYSSPKATENIMLAGNLNFLAVTTSPDEMHVATIAFYDTVGNRYVADVNISYDKTEEYWVAEIAQGPYYDENGMVVLAADNSPALAPLMYPNGDRTLPPVPLEGFAPGDAADQRSMSFTFGFDERGKLSHINEEAISEGAVVENETVRADGSKITINIEPLGDYQTSPPALFGTAGTGNITLDLTDLTQFNDTTSAKFTSKDGNAPGSLQGISVSSDGSIMGRYSNGDTKLLGQIPIAKFKNPAGLESIGSNLFTTSANSGEFDGIGEETANMMGGVLEMSNVDLSGEFTDMITTQRGFQANSRIITTSDDMLQELVNLKR